MRGESAGNRSTPMPTSSADIVSISGDATLFGIFILFYFWAKRLVSQLNGPKMGRLLRAFPILMGYPITRTGILFLTGIDSY